MRCPLTALHTFFHEGKRRLGLKSHFILLLGRPEALKNELCPHGRHDKSQVLWLNNFVWLYNDDKIQLEA